MATDLTPAQAWHELCRGNARFVQGHPEHPNQDLSTRVATAATSQSPFAIVFGCMDSRVAAEIVFDRGLGDLAVVRTAGHVMDAGVLGSIEFGVTVLGIPLVVVLGHDSCGAITAALAAHRTGQVPGGYVRDIVERVGSSVVTASQPGRGLDEIDPQVIMEEHVRQTLQLIAERSVPIADRLRSGEVGLVGCGYRLAEGQVHLVDAIGELDVAAQGALDR